jgi:intracellular sulfur oxidation DsrE/DsrF family protein
MRSAFIALVLWLAAVGTGAAAETKTHHLLLQVSTNDPAVMNLTLNNARNVAEHYSGVGEEVEIEIVAYGPGLHMLRDDTSPVKQRLHQFADSMPNVAFAACGNTQHAMEKAEGKEIKLLPNAKVVEAGVVRIMELQEQGWSYVRP